MWIPKLTLLNIRGFSDHKYDIELSKNINIVVGQNNSGKSTILKSIYLLQQSSAISISDLTQGKNVGEISINLEDLKAYNLLNPLVSASHNIYIKPLIRGESSDTYLTNNAGFRNIIDAIPNSNKEPQNIIYPYFSRRKVSDYREDVNLDSTNSVVGNFSHLYAKINRLCNVNHPKSQDYQQYCKDIIGFPISTVASQNGQRAAYILDTFSDIPLTSMGEGVANLLGLIVDLCIAENKIFLIEEPENDIHPKALKSLLELIARKSENNQFIISTHSNIVTKYLGSVDNAKVFRVSMALGEPGNPPISKVEEVPGDPESRLKLLEELGYEPFDFSQWKAWLILEESSAEVVIREILIPLLVPNLKNKLRTYSASSLSEVEPKFKDFNNLFVFVHLEQIYKNKAWVIVDDGENEKAIIDKMKAQYAASGWNEQQFLQFSEHDFERYYPEIFKAEVDEVLAIGNKQEKRERKKQLVEKVKQWAKDNPEESAIGFTDSAKEIVKILEKIAAEI